MDAEVEILGAPGMFDMGWVFLLYWLVTMLMWDWIKGEVEELKETVKTGVLLLITMGIVQMIYFQFFEEKDFGAMIMAPFEWIGEQIRWVRDFMDPQW